MFWLDSLCQKFGVAVQRRRAWFLLTALLLSAFFVWRAPSIESVSDLTAYLPRDRFEVAQWLDLNRRFGALDLLVVGLEEPEMGLSATGLASLAEVTRRLSDLQAEGVLSVRSLTNVDTVIADETGTLHADRLVPTLPKDDEERDALARRVLGDVLVVGSLVSRDLRGYLIVVRPDPRRDSREVSSLVESVVEAWRGPLKAYYFGGPFVANLITRKVYERLPWLVPLFAFTLFAVLFVGLRRVGASRNRKRIAFVVTIILACSGLSLVWWTGLLSVFGLSLTMSDVNGLLLVLVASALFFATLADDHLRGAEQPSGGPVAFLIVCGASLLVLQAMGPLVPIPLPHLGRLGALLAVGLLASLALGLVGVWPLLTLVRVQSVPRFSLSRRRLPWLAALLLLVAASVAAFQVRFVLGLRDLFSPSDEVGATLAFFERRFGGSDFIQVSARGDLRDPAVLARIHRLTNLLEGAQVGEDPGLLADVRSISQVIAFLAQNFGGAYRIPSDRESVDTLWFLLEGNEDIRTLVTASRDEAMLALRIPPDRDIKEIAATVQAAIHESLDIGVSGAVRRLDAVARLFGLVLPVGWSAQILQDHLAEGPKPLSERTVAALRRELESPEFPFSPTDREFEAIVSVLGGPNGTSALENLVRSLPSFRALNAPDDWPARIVRVIEERVEALVLEERAARVVERWLSQVSSDRVSDALRARATGIVRDAMAPVDDPGERVHFQVTGYPLVLSALENDLKSGLFRTLFGVVVAVFFAGWAASRRLVPPSEYLVRSVFGGLAPLGVAWATSLHVDSGSSALIFVGPIAAGLLAPVGSRPVASAIALALAAAGSTLALTGMLPVARIGFTLGFALACGWLASGFAYTLFRATREDAG